MYINSCRERKKASPELGIRGMRLKSRSTPGHSRQSSIDSSSHSRKSSKGSEVDFDESEEDSDVLVDSTPKHVNKTI